jgi:hypothetical protein
MVQIAVEDDVCGHLKRPTLALTEMWIIGVRLLVCIAFTCEHATLRSPFARGPPRLFEPDVQSRGYEST